MNRNTLTMAIAEGMAPLTDAVASGLEFVPGLGIAVGILKTVDDFRNRALMVKLKAFLDGLGHQSLEDTEAMADRFRDPKESQQMGETLLLTLDGYTALEKCSLLGKLFRAYLQKRLNNQDFRRLALAINVAFPDDLLEFLSLDLHNMDLIGAARCMPYLVPAGLVDEKTYGGLGSLDPGMQRLYHYTALGLAFRSAINGD